MSDPFTASLIVGAGISAFGAISEGNAKASAAKQDAAIKQEQAKQVQVATDREIDLERIRETGVAGDVQSAAAKGGVEAGGSTLLALENVHHQATMERIAMQEEANYKKGMLQMGADLSNSNAGNYQTAGELNAAGSVLQSGFNYGKASGAFDKTTGPYAKVGP